jgi:hypothetical protein
MPQLSRPRIFGTLRDGNTVGTVIYSMQKCASECRLLAGHRIYPPKELGSATTQA